MNKFKQIYAACICIATSSLMLASCGGGDSGGGIDPIHPRSWGTPELIETDNAGKASNPQITVNASGNAFAIWVQNNGSQDNILTRKFTTDSGWEATELISTGDASNPQIAINIDGNAIAVWQQKRTRIRNGISITVLDIRANRYTVDSGWGGAELIEMGGNAYRPQVVIDADGNALSVWDQFDADGARNDVWANRFTESSGWGAAELIETADSGSASSPKIATDSDGNALVVWAHFNGNALNILSNRYTVGSGWSTEIKNIDGNFFTDSRSPQIATDLTGNAIAVWDEYDGNRRNIWTNRYTVDIGWGIGEVIETASESASEPKIAIDATGNALAVWYQQTGVDGFSLWANRYTKASGWSTATLIKENIAKTDDGFEGPNLTLQIAVDAVGNGLVVFEEDGGGANYNIWSSRYTIGSGWGSTELVENPNGGNSSNPQIAIDSFGDGAVVWQEFDGVRDNIWVNRFE